MSALLLWLSLAHAQPRAPVDLAGTWRFSAGDAGLSTLYQAGPTLAVPSNWTTEGQDLSGVVWFSRSVEVPDGGRWVLALGGVDYACEVYWDGQPIGGHTGYFSPFEVGIPQGSGFHTLAIRVDSPNEKEANFSLHKQLIKGVLGHHDTRPGGAWSPDGQDAPTGGIWGSVKLLPLDRAHLDLTRIDTVALNAQAATLRVRVRVTEATRGGRLAYVLRDTEGQAVASGALGRFAQNGDVTAEIRVPNPRLWWPAERGAPDLYTLEVHLGEDRVQTRFGIRTVVQDARGRLLLNGTPLFLRGTNYIGSIYLSQLNEAAVARDLDLMAAAHINAIRVHAHVSAPALYEAADARGLLIFQDFPLQWGYDDSAAFRDEATRQLREMIDLLAVHPSIVFWTAHNEAPWSSDWMQWKYPDWDPDQNRALDKALGDTLAEADPTRPFEANAPPAEHAWLGWYSGSAYDFSRAVDRPILTEYGAQALPDLATLETFLPEDRRWPLDEETLKLWAWHGFQLHELSAHVPLGDALPALIAATQAYQAKVIKLAAEELRRQKWMPVTGIFQFMFVEHWPSMTWGVVDHLRHPKAGYSALAQAYQPILPLITVRPHRPGHALYVVNDTQRAFPQARLHLRGSSVWGETASDFTVDLPADSVVEVGRDLPAPRPDEALQLTLTSTSGEALGANDYAPGWFEGFPP